MREGAGVVTLASRCQPIRATLRLSSFAPLDEHQGLPLDIEVVTQYVTPFVKTNKKVRNDAEAIVEAASRPAMRCLQSSRLLPTLYR